MKKQSAGILVYRKNGKDVEVLLTHPGGPIWAKRDTWSIPKGELDGEEDYLAAARREFSEEVGVEAPRGELIHLGSVPQGTGKENHIWAVEGTVDVTKFRSNLFTMEWPPKSGRQQEFPENDRAAWFDISMAKQKVYTAQATFFDRLAEKLGIQLDGPAEQ